MAWQIVNPSPVPPPGRFVVKNGSKIFARIFRRDSRAIVRKHECDFSIDGFHSNAQGAVIAPARNGLLRIDDQIHEHLLQQPGIGVHGRQALRRFQLNRHIFLPQRRLLLVDHLLDHLFGAEFFARQRRRSRKCQQVLHDSGGAPSLLQHNFHLPARGIVGGAFAHQVADAQYGRQRII